jgi:hypothetical protein
MAVVVAALLIATGFGLLRIRALVRRRRTESKEDRELAALRRVLTRIDGPVSPRLTLWQVESRLERVAGPPAARYVRMLRVRRYSARGGRMPDATARRELRRALVRGRGLRARFGALSALPPVSFRRG